MIEVRLPDPELEARVAEFEKTEPKHPDFQPVRSLLFSLAYGLAGSLIWVLIWYLTDYSLGLIAILLGILAGNGAAKGGRGRTAQIMGASIAALCFFVAKLGMVFMLIGREPQIDLWASLSDAEQGPAVMGAIFESFVLVLQRDLSGIGLLFLGFAVWEGYRIPRS